MLFQANNSLTRFPYLPCVKLKAAPISLACVLSNDSEIRRRSGHHRPSWANFPLWEFPSLKSEFGTCPSQANFFRLPANASNTSENQFSVRRIQYCVLISSKNSGQKECWNANHWLKPRKSPLDTANERSSCLSHDEVLISLYLSPGSGCGVCLHTCYKS